MVRSCVLILAVALGGTLSEKIISDSALRLLNQYRVAYAAKEGHGKPSSPAQMRAMPVDPTDATEYGVNRWNPELFETDIALTEGQASQLLDSVSQGAGGRQKRAVIASSRSKWSTTTVPYRFAFSGDSTRRARIREGLAQWESTTCLRFAERSTSGPSLNFIVGGGCYSNVGSVGRRQDVSIGRGCETPGIVAHEVGHAMGMWHEQSRPDRDRYMRVNFENIQSGTASNFAKQSSGRTDDLGVNLDIGSVMMYGTSAFSTNGRPTISALDSNYANTFGNRAAISFTDVKQMNLLYCGGVCRGSNLRCANGGYPDPKDCRRCRCPDGLGGPSCSQAAPARCGGTLAATSAWQSISASSQDCAWLLQSNGGTVELELSRINYSRRSSCTRYVEVKYTQDLEVAGPRFCGVSGRTLRSQTSQMVVLSKGSGSFTGRFRSFGGRPGPVVTPTPVPTTRRPLPATTRRPPRTVRPPFRTTARPTGSTQWSQWSRCSLPCGGCGTRSRVRVINNGRTTQRMRQRCNDQPCGRRSDVPDDPPTDDEGLEEEPLSDGLDEVQIDQPILGSEAEGRVKRQSSRDFCCEGYRVRRGRCVRGRGGRGGRGGRRGGRSSD